jgi:hypothetical protein
MIAAALLLARAGYPEYWSHVERFARNQLVEQQLVDVDAIAAPEGEREDTEAGCYGDMRAKAAGGFWVLAYANDAPSFLAGCCCATGPRGLYLVWDAAVEKRPDGVYVNLPLNRRSEWLDVACYYPHQGKAEITIRDASVVFYRVPAEWAGESRSRIGTVVRVDGRIRAVRWRGCYVRIEGLKPGQKVEIIHPLRREETCEIAGGREYRLTWRGSTIVGISPSGQQYPLYERSAMDAESAPMVESTFGAADVTPLKARIHW